MDPLIFGDWPEEVMRRAGCSAATAAIFVLQKSLRYHRPSSENFRLRMLQARCSRSSRLARRSYCEAALISLVVAIPGHHQQPKNKMLTSIPTGLNHYTSRFVAQPSTPSPPSPVGYDGDCWCDSRTINRLRAPLSVLNSSYYRIAHAPAQ